MYLLLTGATGLLGRYLLRDLSLRQVPLAVIARPQRQANAADRIETILARWERILRRSLPRPIVLSGSMQEEDLGLSPRDLEWLSRHCTRILHSAASLKFTRDPATGEPWTSNVAGTDRLIALCAALRIREFHQVSSAYVAGLRQGRVRETELDVGQAWGNVYEETKCQAEQRLRGSPHLESLTIYRPSIIVGDSQTGYSSTYHGFYAPLRLGYAAAPKLSRDVVSSFSFLDLFGLQGTEGKNLVPVDWVSAAISQILTTPGLHGLTYHLTSPWPVPVGAMQDAFLQVLEPLMGRPSTTASELAALVQDLEGFRQQMRVYEAYWREDPRFDRNHTDRALPDLPCPILDKAKLILLSEAAVRDNFGWPQEPVQRASNEVADYLQNRSLDDAAALCPHDVVVGLEVTGPGGTSWHYQVEEGTVRASGPGLPAASPQTITYYLSSRVFWQLCSRNLAPRAAIDAGRVAVFTREERKNEDPAHWLEIVTSRGTASQHDPLIP